MAQKLAREIGLGVGISSGANFLGAVIAQDQLDESAVTVFPDDTLHHKGTKITKKSLSLEIDCKRYRHSRTLNYGYRAPYCIRR